MPTHFEKSCRVFSIWGCIFCMCVILCMSVSKPMSSCIGYGVTLNIGGVQMISLWVLFKLLEEWLEKYDKEVWAHGVCYLYECVWGRCFQMALCGKMWWLLCRGFLWFLFYCWGNLSRAWWLGAKHGQWNQTRFQNQYMWWIYDSMWV